MVYSFAVTTPKNTPSTAPVHTPCMAQQGLIYRFEVYFPPGSSGLMGVAVNVAGVQFYPSNRLSWFIGDDVLFGYDDRRMFDDPNVIFDVVTYNADTVYNHIVLVNIGILTEQNEIDSVLLAPSIGALQISVDALTKAVETSNQNAINQAAKILGTAPKAP